MSYRYGGAIKFAQVSDQAWRLGSTVESRTIKAKKTSVQLQPDHSAPKYELKTRSASKKVSDRRKSCAEPQNK